MLFAAEPIEDDAHPDPPGSCPKQVFQYPLSGFIQPKDIGVQMNADGCRINGCAERREKLLSGLQKRDRMAIMPASWPGPNRKKPAWGSHPIIMTLRVHRLLFP